MEVIKCASCGKCYMEIEGQYTCPFCGKAIRVPDKGDYEMPDFIKDIFK